MRRIELALIATTYGTGPYHPAYRSLHGDLTWYWPNVTKETEEEAYKFALRAMKDAEDAAETVAQQWNLDEV